MPTPVNPFKAALAARRPQLGLWLTLADAYSAEICATAGFDWLLVDGEHSPNDLRSMLAIAQAIAGYPASHPIARIPMGHGHVGQALIKQVLDIGYQTLLVPMVDTPEQAAELVRCMRYPPAGVRGIGGSRASRWGQHAGYAHEANDQVCLLVQVETRTGLDNLDAIAATEGVDGVFIGPNDLSASLGYLGQQAHPDVQALIVEAIGRIGACGKAAGILAQDEAIARKYMAAGCVFTAVGVDASLLAQAARGLAARLRGPAGTGKAA